MFGLPCEQQPLQSTGHRVHCHQLLQIAVTPQEEEEPLDQLTTARLSTTPGELARGLLHAGVSWIVTHFSVVTAVASQALPALPGASLAREVHHADLEPPWADLGRPSRSVPAARA